MASLLLFFLSYAPISTTFQWYSPRDREKKMKVRFWSVIFSGCLKKRAQIVLYYKWFINKQNESPSNKHMSNDMDYSSQYSRQHSSTQPKSSYNAAFFCCIVHLSVVLKWIHIAHIIVTSGLRIEQRHTGNTFDNNNTHTHTTNSL